jgi:hypothetical protein
VPNPNSIPLPSIQPVGFIDNEADHKGMWQYMSLLALEDSSDRDNYIKIAEISTTVFNWGDWPKPAIDAMQVNQIKNDTEAITKTTFREPVAFEITCSDTGPYAPCFWAGPPEIGMQLGLMPEQLGIDPLTGQPGQIQPLSQMQGYQLTQIMAQAQYPSDWLVHADKRTVSAIYQTYFDGVWTDPQFNGQQWATRFGLDCNTQGWNTAIYEWRDDTGDVIIPLSIKQCYLDRQQTFINKMQHVMADLVLDVTYAKQQFPWIAEQIDKYKQKGGMTPIPIDGNTRWGLRDNALFQRDIVTMRIGWFRDQPMPLTPQEAIDGGHVQPQAVYGETAGGNSPEGLEVGGDPNSQGQPVGPDAGSGGGNLPTTSGYTTADGSPVTEPTKGSPIDPNWPMRTCTRFVIAIAGNIVSDMPNDHWDIPVLHLVARPVTNTPFGVGIPFLCWQVQKARTQGIADTGTHLEFYAKPMVAGPTDVLESLGTNAKGIFCAPNAILKISPNYLQNGRKITDVVQIINPPPMPTGTLQALPILENVQTQLSGNVAPLRGDVPDGDQSSGKKLMALQEAAINQVNTGDDVECCFQRLGMHMQHAHVHFASADQVYSHYRKIPKPILEYIHTQIAPTLKWECKVTVATGAGAMIQRRRQEALAYNAAVDPLTLKPHLDQQSTREILDIDNEEVEERQQAAVAERAMMEAQAAQSTQKPGEKKPSNGQPQQQSGNGNGMGGRMNGE